MPNFFHVHVGDQTRVHMLVRPANLAISSPAFFFNEGPGQIFWDICFRMIELLRLFILDLSTRYHENLFFQSVAYLFLFLINFLCV